MATFKFRILNKFGVAEPLGNPDEIEFYFPYKTADALVKRMKYGAVKILSDAKAELEVEVTPFEFQGFLEGDNQNVNAKIYKGSRVQEAVFERALHVKTIQTPDGPRKVAVKK